MKLVDANVLLYATDESAPQHAVAKSWLDSAMSGSETVLLPWICLLAFVRLATHQAIYDRPLSAAQALDIVEKWQGQPNVMTPEPDLLQPKRMLTLLDATGAGGNLVNDAYLAALAQQFGATVVTFDSDFGRFPGIDWATPG
mgnify:CR=1 FL=1